MVDSVSANPFDTIFFVAESAGEDEEEEAAEEGSMTNKSKAGDTDTYIDMLKTDGMLPITSLLEKPPVLDKKVKVGKGISGAKASERL